MRYWIGWSFGWLASCPGPDSCCCNEWTGVGKQGDGPCSSDGNGSKSELLLEEEAEEKVVVVV